MVNFLKSSIVIIKQKKKLNIMLIGDTELEVYEKFIIFRKPPQTGKAQPIMTLITRFKFKTLE
jgi:hypothetical protein